MFLHRKEPFRNLQTQERVHKTSFTLPLPCTTLLYYPAVLLPFLFRSYLLFAPRVHSISSLLSDWTDHTLVPEVLILMLFSVRRMVACSCQPEI